MTEAAKTTTKKPTTAKAETAPKPAPKVEAKDRPASPVQTGDLMETITYGTLTVAFFLIFASMIYHFVL